MKRTLSRRTLLRGMGLSGIAVALPPLEATAASAELPVRLLTFFFPNGCNPTSFWPAAEATGPLQLTPELAPLAPHAGQVVVVKNLYKRERETSKAKAVICAHFAATGSFSTGCAATEGGGGGPSIEQIAAAKLGEGTRLRSLPVGIGFAKEPWTTHISWAAKDVPVPAEREPVRLFNRLFGARGDDPQLVADRKSVLDFVRADAARLNGWLGKADRERVDLHLTSIREMEQELSMWKSCAPPAPVPENKSALSNDRARLLMRLLVHALACDITRYASFQLRSKRDYHRFGNLGLSDRQHHDISHDTTAEGRTLQTRVVAEQMEQAAFLLGLLRAVPLPDGRTLLDDALVMIGSEHGEGLSHNARGVPLVLAGGARGRLAGGRVVVPPPDTPWANALASVLTLAGVPTAKFGEFGTGRITELG